MQEYCGVYKRENQITWLKNFSSQYLWLIKVICIFITTNSQNNVILDLYG